MLSQLRCASARCGRARGMRSVQIAVTYSSGRYEGCATVALGGSSTSQIDMETPTIVARTTAIKNFFGKQWVSSSSLARLRQRHSHDA